jgi:hypothetical protein
MGDRKIMILAEKLARLNNVLIQIDNSTDEVGDVVIYLDFKDDLVAIAEIIRVVELSGLSLQSKNVSVLSDGESGNILLKFYFSKTDMAVIESVDSND